MKGFFIFFVFVRHFLQYDPVFAVNSFNTIGVLINRYLGQLIVTLFLFYSGYGVMESAKMKGKNYIDSIPRKRILMTLVNFDIAVLIYMIVSILLKLEEFSVKHFLLSLVALEGFGNSAWYIFCIEIMYLISYVALKLFKVNNKLVGFIFICITVYMFGIYFIKHNNYWFNTAYCYGVGCFWSVNKNKIHKYLVEHEKKVTLIAGVIFLASYSYFYMGPRFTNVVYPFTSVSFCVLFIMLTRHIYLKNNILRLAGESLFLLYIYQRLPMIIFQQIDTIYNNGYIYFIVCLITTVLLAYLYSKITVKLKRELVKWIR